MAVSDTLPGVDEPLAATAKLPLSWLGGLLRFGLAARIALATALIGTVCLASLTAFMYRGTVDAMVTGELRELSATDTTAALRFAGRIDFARQDALFLSRTAPVTGIVRAQEHGGTDPLDGSSGEVWKSRLASLFAAMLAARPEYFQVRYIDPQGDEIVRVDRSLDGQVDRVADDALQNKADRPYVAETLRLAEGEIYVSDIDLNREHGEVEKPYRPVLRVGTPALDASGNLIGMVVVNVGVDRFFEIIAQTVRKGVELYVTNQDGDFLYHPDPTRTFGFDLGQPHRMQDELPGLASVFTVDGVPSSVSQPVFSGLISTSSQEYMADAQRIYFDPLRPQRYFVLASLWPTAEAANRIVALRNQTAIATGLLLLFGLVGVIWLAGLLTRPLRKITEAAVGVAMGDRSTDLGKLTARSDETGELARAFEEMVRQVTAREQELADQADALSRSNHELSQFAYVASHDLQEPLRMVGSYLGLIARRYQGKLDAEADEFIAYAVDGAGRMKRLINDLLAYSRVSNRPMTPEAVDAGKVVAAARNLLAERISESNATIVVDPLPEILADAVQMERLFLNLIENAIKYRGEALPRIRVSAERQGDFWEFSIADNGIGIDPAFADKVFEIFARLHARDKYEGTGIGLAACKRIVERHGGTIRVEPSPGGGSVFRFTLPAIGNGGQGNA